MLARSIGDCPAITLAPGQPERPSQRDLVSRYALEYWVFLNLTKPHGGPGGGGGGIRTHETLARLPVFKTGAFNRSATPPWWLASIRGRS